MKNLHSFNEFKMNEGTNFKQLLTGVDKNYATKFDDFLKKVTKF